MVLNTGCLKILFLNAACNLPFSLFSCSMDLVVFARFLSLLAAYSWEDEPLLVNFNKEISGIVC